MLAGISELNKEQAHATSASWTNLLRTRENAPPRPSGNCYNRTSQESQPMIFKELLASANMYLICAKTINSGKGLADNRKSPLLEFSAFRLIPVICPARRAKQESYWNR